MASLITPTIYVVDNIHKPIMHCFIKEPHYHYYTILDSNETDEIQKLFHLLNDMRNDVLQMQFNMLKISYEYLKVMKIGRHVRRD